MCRHPDYDALLVPRRAPLRLGTVAFAVGKKQSHDRQEVATGRYTTYMLEIQRGKWRKRFDSYNGHVITFDLPTMFVECVKVFARTVNNSFDLRKMIQI